MSYQEVLAQNAVAISVSESADMASLGLTDEHLKDAMAEIARHLLALGSRLIYGGDLRQYGFSELLFELVARHGRDADAADDRPGVTNYLAWPVHITKLASAIDQQREDLAGTAELVCLRLDGTVLSAADRTLEALQQPNDSDWAAGLTAMRKVMRSESHARIVLGGRTEGYKGSMPGIAEEALLSLEQSQPLFVLGGFGGCARDIAETVGLLQAKGQAPTWQGLSAFSGFSSQNLNNGLDDAENAILARTPHVDQAIVLILRGLSRTVAVSP